MWRLERADKSIGPFASAEHADHAEDAGDATLVEDS
jgi:hypothetical protein